MSKINNFSVKTTINVTNIALVKIYTGLIVSEITYLKKHIDYNNIVEHERGFVTKQQHLQATIEYKKKFVISYV